MKKVLIAILGLLGAVLSSGAVDFNKQLQLPDFSGKTVWIVRAGVGFNGVTGDRKDVQQRQWSADGWSGEFKCVTGYDFSFGFNKSFGGSHIFWGMDLALGMRGYTMEAKKYTTADNAQMGAYNHRNRQQIYSIKAYTVRLTPITVGYRYSFLKRMAAEVHLGGFVSYDFAGNCNYDNIDVTNSGNTGTGSVNMKPTSLVTDKSQSMSGSLGDLQGQHRIDAGLNLGIGYWFGHFNIDFSWQRGFISYDDKGKETVEIAKKKGQPLKVKYGNLYANSFMLKLGYAF